LLNPTKGDLVHVPASVVLCKFVEASDDVRMFTETEKPMTAVFLERQDNNRCKIYYNGDYWCIPIGDLYTQ